MRVCAVGVVHVHSVAVDVHVEFFQRKARSRSLCRARKLVLDRWAYIHDFWSFARGLFGQAMVYVERAAVLERLVAPAAYVVVIVYANMLVVMQ